MTPKRVEGAVNSICSELALSFSHSPNWENRTESELFREMVASILGSRVSFEIALVATDALEKEGLLEHLENESIYLKKLTEVLSRPLFSPEWPRLRRYRFPKVRANSISQTSNAFYANGGNIRNWLKSFNEPTDARRGVIDKAHGIGPKQASMFLRNVGYSNELAILDSHVLRFMNFIGLIDEVEANIATIRRYEHTESKFLNYAYKIGWSAGLLDQAVWIVMRVYQRELT